MWWSISEPDDIPENQRPECDCRSCRSQGYYDQDATCIWFRSAE